MINLFLDLDGTLAKFNSKKMLNNENAEVS